MRSAASTKNHSELKRFFVRLPEKVLSLPVDVTVADSVTAHHLKSVLRAKPGEAVVIVDADSQTAYEAVITDLQKSSVAFRLEAQLPSSRDLVPRVTLAVALIKEQRWDWLLQKATELGAWAIQPLMTERSIIRIEEKDFLKKQERWQSVLRSAAEQSEGLFIPIIERPLSLQNFLTEPQNALCLLLQERGETRQPLKAAMRNHQSGQPIVIAVGPEGGWTNDEFARFEQSGFTGVSLGRRILRAETAAVAAMAAIVYETGD